MPSKYPSIRERAKVEWGEVDIFCPSCGRDTGESGWRDDWWDFEICACPNCGFKFFAYPEGDGLELHRVGGGSSPPLWQPEIDVARVETVTALLCAMDDLPDRTFEVLRLRFGLDGDDPKTLEEVGVIFDRSRERIRRIQDEALKHLRRAITGSSTTLDRLLSEGERLL